MTAQEAEKPDRHLTDRKEYLRGRLGRSGSPFGLTNGKPDLVREYPDSGHVGAAGQFYERGEMVYRFNISFHADGWAECEQVFISVGDAVEAYSGQVTPGAATQALRAFHSAGVGHATSPDIVQEAAKLQAALESIRRQLPILVEPTLAGRSHPAQPQDLGWINYWSPQTCEYLGFPDAERDRNLLAHSHRTPGGAWLVKLSSEPLDFARPEHLGVFADIYARFPKLGVRAPEKRGP